jgi:hypothetical protein
VHFQVEIAAELGRRKKRRAMVLPQPVLRSPVRAHAPDGGDLSRQRSRLDPERTAWRRSVPAVA